MDNKTWFKLYRKIDESELWHKPPEWFKIWIYILKEVNYKDSNGVERGERLLTAAQITAGCYNVTVNQVESFLKWARKEQILTTRKTTRGMYIKVLNYAKYQDGDTDTNPDENPDRTRTEPGQNPNDSIRRKEGKKERKQQAEMTDLEKTLAEFYKMRVTIKSKMTDRAKELLNSKLEKMSCGDDKLKILLLEQSIENGWKTIYELKGDYKQKTQDELLDEEYKKLGAGRFTIKYGDDKTGLMVDKFGLI